MKALQARKQEIDERLHHALLTTRRIREGEEVELETVRHQATAERAEWIQTVIQDELEKPLMVSKVYLP